MAVDLILLELRITSIIDTWLIDTCRNVRVLILYARAVRPSDVQKLKCLDTTIDKNQ